MQIIINGLCRERAEPLPGSRRDRLRIPVLPFSKNSGKDRKPACSYSQTGLTQGIVGCGGQGHSHQYNSLSGMSQEYDKINFKKRETRSADVILDLPNEAEDNKVCSDCHTTCMGMRTQR